ncbi:MAG: tetratricopeptide repeat protein [Bacteroidota bacterium]
MKKLFFLFAILFLFQHQGYSQKQDQELIDSLLLDLSKTKEDSARMDLLAGIMFAHINYNPKNGLTFQKEALELAQKTKLKSGSAKIKDGIGRLHWRMGNFDEALKNHFEALDLYTRIGDKYTEGGVLVEIAQDYLDGGKYDEAKTYLLRALKLSEETGDKVTMAAAYDVMAFLYEQEGNTAESVKAGYSYLKINEQTNNKAGIAHGAAMLALNLQALGNNVDALKYFKQAMLAAKEAGDKIEEADIKSGIGNIYIANGNFPEALKYYSDALAIANETKDVPILATIYHGLGNLYRAKGNYTEALKNYLITEEHFKAVANKQGLAGLYAEMGVAYTHLKKYDMAKKSFNDAIVIYRSLNSKLYMADYYRGIALLDSATGDWKNAYLNYKDYIILRDSSFNKETLKKLVASQMQYESDKKEAVAKADREKKDLVVQEEIKRQRNIRNSAFAVLGVALLFSVVVYRQRNKIAGEKKRSDQLVIDKELLLREIHHRVKNNLEVVSSLLALQSAQIDDPNTKEAIQQGQNRVHSIGIVHQKLYQGRDPGAIEMKDYFVNLSESILDSFGAESRVNIEFAMEKLNVDIDTAVPLGLIVNELLTNTLKYAFPNKQQGSVRIKLEKQAGGVLHLEVSDNGIGKSGVTQGTGFGGQLVSLLTRQLNGSMKEEIKNGTRIFFDFKMDKVA